jgi:hypothetical protein
VEEESFTAWVEEKSFTAYLSVRFREPHKGTPETPGFANLAATFLMARREPFSRFTMDYSLVNRPAGHPLSCLSTLQGAAIGEAPRILLISHSFNMRRVG